MYISLENLDHSGHLDPTYGNDLDMSSHYLCNSSDILFSNTSYRPEEIYLYHLPSSSPGQYDQAPLLFVVGARMPLTHRQLCCLNFSRISVVRPPVLREHEIDSRDLGDCIVLLHRMLDETR